MATAATTRNGEQAAGNTGKQRPHAEAELVDLIERTMGAAVTSCRPVTSHHGRSRRRAYRVELDGGRLVKVRQLWDEARAREIESILRTMKRRHFPRPLVRVGAALFLEWIEGEALNAISVTPDLYRKSGRILAWLHAMPAGDHDSRAALGHLVPRRRADVEALRSWGLLSPREAAGLLNRLNRHRPHNGELRITHGDFAGENLVLSREGEVYSIDNEALGPGFPEADLARALLRWGLAGDAEEAFLAGYRELRPLDAFRRHGRFWRLVSLIRSVRFRYRCREADYQPALSLLKQALREP